MRLEVTPVIIIQNGATPTTPQWRYKLHYTCNTEIHCFLPAVMRNEQDGVEGGREQRVGGQGVDESRFGEKETFLQENAGSFYNLGSGIILKAKLVILYTLILNKYQQHPMLMQCAYVSIVFIMLVKHPIFLLLNPKTVIYSIKLSN